MQQHLPFTVLKLQMRIVLQQVLTSCNSTYRLRYWNHSSQERTKPVNSTVATAPTVYGIETFEQLVSTLLHKQLQQHLPFTVLKLVEIITIITHYLTGCNSTYRLRYWNVTWNFAHRRTHKRCNSTYRLRYWNPEIFHGAFCVEVPLLQQHLPFTVLKLNATLFPISEDFSIVATAPTVYGIETGKKRNYYENWKSFCCNSTYRLRYWNCPKSGHIFNWQTTRLQQHLPFTVLKLLEDSLTAILTASLTLQQHLPFTVLKLS